MRSRHARHTIVAVALMLASVTLGFVRLAPSAGAQTPTKVSFTMSPTGLITSTTRVTFHVVVSPAKAAGTAALIVNGRQAASAMMVNGSVDITVAPMGPGFQQLQATFQPADPSTYSWSASAAQMLQVVTPIHITVAIANGKVLPPGAVVALGSTVAVAVTGFPKSTTALARLLPSKVIAAFSTDGSGAGRVLMFLPHSLPIGDYRLTATAGAVLATFALRVYDPNSSASPTPTPTPSSPTPVATGTTPPATVSPGEPSAASSVSVAAAVEGIPATGSTPQLAHTGAELADLVPLSVAMFGGGMLMLAWSRNLAPVRGRHTSAPSRPKHAR